MFANFTVDLSEDNLPDWQVADNKKVANSGQNSLSPSLKVELRSWRGCDGKFRM
jgi:hypothetical protein